MPPLCLLIKPASGSCNMRCRYCFYTDETENRSVALRGAMSRQTMETIVDKALAYAAQMVEGSARMVLESGKHPGVLKDAVCSPGGSTIQGVRALEEGGFRAAAMNAVIKSYEKTLQLK